MTYCHLDTKVIKYNQPFTDLRNNLSRAGKTELLEETKKISDLANFAYVRQKGPYGSATPLMNVAHLVGDEPFIYTYADDLVPSSPNRFKQMIDLYDELKGSIVPCIEVSSDEEYDRYGIVDGEPLREDVLKMSSLVEKPGKANAPSSFASVGGYLLTPDVFDYIDAAKDKLKPNEEFYLTTYALDPMVRDGKPLYACALKDSKYYDTGNKLEYVKTVIDFALQHEDMKEDILSHIRTKF